MRKPKTTVAPKFLPLSKQERDRILSRHLLRDHIRFSPNYFLTVRLYLPADCRTPGSLNEKDRPNQLEAGKWILRALDFAVYGSLSRRSDIASRFPYFMRLETVSRAGMPCKGHWHILFKLNPMEEVHFLRRKEKLQITLPQNLLRLGFTADFMLLDHDGQNCSYLAKFPDADILNIFTRNHPI